jgi:creatinase
MNQMFKGMPNELLRLQKMHNGEKAPPTFSAAEMTRRQDGLRRILEDLKLDAAILTSYHNICYFSDFMYCYFGRRYAFVVTETEGRFGQRRHRRRPALAAAPSATTSPIPTGSATTISARSSNSVSGGRQDASASSSITCQLERIAKLLEDAFPGVRVRRCRAATMWLRTIKSAEEIAHHQGRRPHGRYWRRGDSQRDPRGSSRI